MILLTTRQKLFIAKTLRGPFALANRLLGCGTNLIARRDDIVWKLDLDEGIDLHIFLFGCFEPTTTKAIAKLLKPGDVVVDIGANIGAHTIPMARRVGTSGHVYAFEPTSFAFQKAVANLQLNPDIATQVTLEQMFITDDSNPEVPSAIYSSWPLDSKEELHPLMCAAAKTTQDAKSSTLDAYVEGKQLTKLDLVKLDVDGYECTVLRGAGRTLERFKPILVMELAPYLVNEHGGSLKELIGHLSKHSYKIVDETSGKELSLNERDLAMLLPYGSGINVIARPI